MHASQPSDLTDMPRRSLVRYAVPSESEIVRRISADAYTPAYLEAIGVVPKPATEDYGPRIERHEVWVLESDSEPIGVLVLEEMPDHLLLYSVAVSPPHQGRGHATALLRFAERQALVKGLASLRLYTNRRMMRNLVLYRRHGFVEIGVRPHPSRPGEVLVDMEKILCARA